MNNKVLTALAIVAIMVCVFAFSASAETFAVKDGTIAAEVNTALVPTLENSGATTPQNGHILLTIDSDYYKQEIIAGRDILVSIRIAGVYSELLESGNRYTYLNAIRLGDVMADGQYREVLTTEGSINDYLRALYWDVTQDGYIEMNMVVINGGNTAAPSDYTDKQIAFLNAAMVAERITFEIVVSNDAAPDWTIYNAQIALNEAIGNVYDNALSLGTYTLPLGTDTPSEYDVDVNYNELLPHYNVYMKFDGAVVGFPHQNEGMYIPIIGFVWRWIDTGATAYGNLYALKSDYTEVLIITDNAIASEQGTLFPYRRISIGSGNVLVTSETYSLFEASEFVSYDEELAYQSGYNAGYNVGYENGNREGYHEGKAEGYTTGYSEGLNKGQTEAALSGGIAGFLTNSLGAFLSMDIFGVGISIGSVIATICGVLLVVVFLKQFAGG